jgi:hypothetical protein
MESRRTSPHQFAIIFRRKNLEASQCVIYLLCSHLMLMASPRAFRVSLGACGRERAHLMLSAINSMISLGQLITPTTHRRAPCATRKFLQSPQGQFTSRLIYTFFNQELNLHLWCRGHSVISALREATHRA